MSHAVANEVKTTVYPRLLRWVLLSQRYNEEAEYIKGAANSVKGFASNKSKDDGIQDIIPVEKGPKES